MVRTAHPGAWLLVAALAGVATFASACANGTTVEEDDADAPPVSADGAVPTDGRAPDGATPVDGRAPDGAVADSALPDGAVPDAALPDGAVPDGAVDSGSDAGACVTAPPSNACGVNPQCGCTATQTCDVTNLTSGGVSCVTAGSVAAGRACTATSGCARGLTCWNGACRPFCTRGTPTCGAGTLCFAPQDAGGLTTPNLDVCSVACDPSRPSATCGTNACVWFSSSSVADCRPPGTRAEYATCASSADCRQGLLCMNDPTFGPECERWCRLGSNVDCSFGDTCTDVFGASAPTVPGSSARVGVCVF